MENKRGLAAEVIVLWIVALIVLAVFLWFGWKYGPSYLQKALGWVHIGGQA